MSLLDDNLENISDDMVIADRIKYFINTNKDALPMIFRQNDEIIYKGYYKFPKKVGEIIYVAVSRYLYNSKREIILIPAHCFDKNYNPDILEMNSRYSRFKTRKDIYGYWGCSPATYLDNYITLNDILNGIA